jgi:4-hydroxy-tetrahydrodipicolinate reductase
MPAALPLVVSGAGGRMGRSIASLVRDDPGFQLIGGIGREEGALPDGAPVVRLERAESLLQRAEVVIDVSAPALLGALLEKFGDGLGARGLVVGTTGLGGAEERLLEQRAAAGPVLTAANFGVGVNVLLGLVRRAAAALPDFDVEIVEAHHRRKEDAPSGTALALGEAVAAGREADLEQLRRDGRSGRPGVRPEGEIGFHSVRGGEIVGEHQVLFLGDMERVEVVHRASDRALFASGALRAARWVAGRPPGRYSMLDVLGLA